MGLEPVRDLPEGGGTSYGWEKAGSPARTGPYRTILVRPRGASDLRLHSTPAVESINGAEYRILITALVPRSETTLLPQSVVVFVSHRWAEGEHVLAMELAKQLATYQGLKVIIDENDLKAGVDIDNWMRTSVRLADIFL